MTNNQLNSVDMSEAKTISRDNLMQQANETRIIRQKQGYLSIVSLFFGFVSLAISLLLLVGFYLINEDPIDMSGYIFIGICSLFVILGLWGILKGFKYIFGEGKILITLTPEGFILPKGNRFTPWNLVVGYDIVVLFYVNHIIEFKVAKTLEDRERFEIKADKPRSFIEKLDKSLLRVIVSGKGFKGLSSKQMTALIQTYIDADNVRHNVAERNINGNQYSFNVFNNYNKELENGNK